MPNGAFLYADQLNEVLTAKSEQGGFKELVSAKCMPGSVLQMKNPRHAVHDAPGHQSLPFMAIGAATIQPAHDTCMAPSHCIGAGMLSVLQLLPLFSMGSVCRQPSRCIGSATHQSGFVAQPCALEAASADPSTEIYFVFSPR